MTTASLDETKSIQNAGMSQIVMLEHNEKARSIVGSCIALTLHHAVKGIGALAHIVLSKSSGRTGPPGKFADTAVPYLLDQLNRQGAVNSGIIAKICGGASMFGPGGPIQIGQENAAAVSRLLEQFSIPIVAADTGGSKGRRITFDCQSGVVTIEIVGQPSTTL